MKKLVTEGLLYMVHFVLMCVYYVFQPVFSWLYESAGQERLPPMKSALLEKSAVHIASMIRSKEVRNILLMSCLLLITYLIGYAVLS